MNGLEIIGLKKAYGETQVLNGLDLHCRSGEIHGLLGQNGSGKSTLSKILSGIVRADGGVIAFHGEKIDPKTPQAARTIGIYTVFQELSVLPNLSVAENLLIGREPMGALRTVVRRRLWEQAEQELRTLGIGQFDPRRLVARLSVAEKQLLEVAKVLIKHPRILILDEATASLGPHESQWVFDQARRVADKGGVVLFTSHRLQEIEHYADRISILRNGVRVNESVQGEKTTSELVMGMLGYKVDQLYPSRDREHSDNPVLELEHFTVERSIHDVSLVVREGEIVGVAAMPGQGQKELFYGVYGGRKSRGVIRLGGVARHFRSPQDAIKAGMGLVPEDRKTEGLLLPLATRHNLSVGILDRLSRAGFLHLKKELDMVRQQCTQLQLPIHRANEPVGHLSGGNQQKVVLGKMLLCEPRCLLLYDCTKGVDVGTKAEIYRVMAELSQRKVGILFYSSDLQELINLSDRVAILFEGRLVKILDGTELREEQILQAAFGSGKSVPDALQAVETGAFL